MSTNNTCTTSGKPDGDGAFPPFPTLLSHACAAVIQLDTEGRVQLWNRAAEKMFGWTQAEVLGKPPPTIANELWEDNKAWFLRCLGGQTVSGVQLQRRRKDGSTINLYAWAWPVLSSHGTVLGVMKMFFPVGERTTRETLTGDQLLQQQTEHAQRFHAALIELSKTEHPNLDVALKTLTAVASKTLQVERVGVWLFDENHQSISCRCLYQASQQEPDRFLKLTADEFPLYFAALGKSRTIAAQDARHDPRTSEYASTYLEPLGITSMLDVPIRLNGKEIGIVCHEHIGIVRDWSLEEQAFAAAIADFVSLLFEKEYHAHTEAALKQSEQMLAAVIHGSPMGIQIFDKAGVLRRQNAAMIELNAQLHHPAEINSFNVLQSPPFTIGDNAAEAASRALAGETVEQSSRRLPTARTGTGLPQEHHTVHIDSIYYPIRNSQREVTGLACFHHDVSERRRLEEQLQQTQRLESLGLLAGTIAHDFNGLLTAIYGFIDLAQTELPEDHQARTYLHSSLQAVLRASDLTQQLLAYAGKGGRSTSLIDLSAITLEVAELLRNLVQRHGQLQLRLAPTLPEIAGDMTQVRQVIMNLISNAAEAQSIQRGTVTVTTGTVTLDGTMLINCQVVASDAMPGEFVFVQVSDEGDGMPPAVRDRIFDPFFTTKSKGRGLGLAAVIGIVRSHKAALRVESIPRQGSSFTLYLPIAKQRSETTQYH